jgi:hypothetical protein
VGGFAGTFGLLIFLLPRRDASAAFPGHSDENWARRPSIGRPPERERGEFDVVGCRHTQISARPVASRIFLYPGYRLRASYANKRDEEDRKLEHERMKQHYDVVVGRNELFSKALELQLNNAKIRLAGLQRSKGVSSTPVNLTGRSLDRGLSIAGSNDPTGRRGYWRTSHNPNQAR